MANDEERREREDLSQDPYIERLRPDPSEPPERVRILEGLMGDSDREGYRRLYFTRELDYYAEFRAEDVVFSESIPPDQPPFLGQQATRVGIKRGATIEFTRVRSPRPVDEFDLDVRLGGAGAAPELLPDPGTQFIGTCVGVACRGGTDRIATCVGPVCNATERPTCQTCQTRSAAATCR